MSDSTTHHSTSSPDPALSVVVPAYNEQADIGKAIAQIRDGADQVNGPIEIIVVDDGSSDDTGRIVQTLIDQTGANATTFQLRLMTLERNLGKARAVQRGVLDAKGRLVLFCDADMSTPFTELKKMTSWLTVGYDVVIGSRDLPDSRLDPPQPFLRHQAGRLFRWLRRRMLLPEVRDTQCGFKLFTRNAARTIFEKQTDQSAAFDCELLSLAMQHHYRIKEVGVHWKNRRETRINTWHDGLGMLRSLFHTARQHRRLMKWVDRH